MKYQFNFKGREFKLDPQLLADQIKPITDKILAVLPCADYYTLVFSDKVADEELRTIEVLLKTADKKEHEDYSKKPSRKPPSELSSLYENKKRDLIKKEWTDLTEVERKILVGIPLTGKELDELGA